MMPGVHPMGAVTLPRSPRRAHPQARSALSRTTSPFRETTAESMPASQHSSQVGITGCQVKKPTPRPTNQERAMGSIRNMPQFLQLEQLRSTAGSGAATISFEQVDITLPELSHTELEVIASTARHLFKEMAQAILTAPAVVQQILTKTLPRQLNHREKQRVARETKKRGHNQ